jgi:hypothetical protein
MSFPRSDATDPNQAEMIAGGLPACPSAAAAACGTGSRQKSHDLARRRRSAAWACSALRPLSLACRSQVPTTPAWYHTSTTGARLGSRSSAITPSTTGRARNHAQHPITLPRTGTQHNERPYHAGITSFPHNAPAYHTGTTGAGTTEDAQRAFRKRNSPLHIQKRAAANAPRTPNGLPISRRERAT